jgi:hypothetical protein
MANLIQKAAERLLGSYEDGCAKSMSHYILEIEGGSRHCNGNDDGNGPMNANPTAETPQP